MSSDRADIYARITNQIIAAIEAGAGEFVMPWHHDGTVTARPTNVASGKAYRGVNTLALWAAAQSGGYPNGLWGTYRQWQALGAQVRKGESSTTVVFWGQIGGNTDDEGDDSPSDAGERRRLFARGYSVFNCAQVDGYEPEPTVARSAEERIAHADAFYANLGINTVYGGNEAYYLPAADRVHVPVFSSFRDVASHYSVLFHEGLHASGAKHRLDRDLSGRFGSEAYAMEEIIADSGAAMILADLSISSRPRPDHAAYISSWLKVLRNDASAIFAASSKAQAAVDWMHARQPGNQVSAAAA
ncbi:zincin-like metallopeptidase domain-containing protein [Mesorhizobium sp. M1300]|uniref:ArdC family protein n=1 Tax=Mesorhizobium sp. M1300 TaxID=2957077 RepID=UPI00333AA5BD